jgi:hypothetical protein
MDKTTTKPVEERQSGGDWLNKLQTGKGAAHPVGQRKATPDLSSHKPDESRESTTTEESALETPQTTGVTETPEANSGGTPKAGETKEVVIDEDTIIVYGDERISAKDAMEFGRFAKPKYDQRVRTVAEQEKELKRREEALRAEAAKLDLVNDDPVLATYLSIRRSQPNISPEKARHAALVAHGQSEGVETEQQEPKVITRPRPPKDAVPGDDEWIKYEEELDKYEDQRNKEFEARLARTVDDRVKPIIDHTEAQRTREEQSRKNKEIRLQNFEANNKLVSSLMDAVLPVDYDSLSDEEQAVIDERFKTAGLVHGIDFEDIDSVSSRRFDIDEVTAIVKNAFPRDFSFKKKPTESSPAETVSRQINNGKPLVPKGKPSQPHTPGKSATEQAPESKSSPTSKKKDAWFDRVMAESKK